MKIFDSKINFLISSNFDCFVLFKKFRNLYNFEIFEISVFHFFCEKNKFFQISKKNLPVSENLENL